MMSGLLVEDDEVLVLEEHIQRDVLGWMFFGGGSAPRPPPHRPRGSPCLSLGVPPFTSHAALIDQFLQLRAAHERDAVGQVLVQPLVPR
jgi:hypothetical protein